MLLMGIRTVFGAMPVFVAILSLQSQLDSSCLAEDRFAVSERACQHPVRHREGRCRHGLSNESSWRPIVESCMALPRRSRGSLVLGHIVTPGCQSFHAISEGNKLF